VNVDKMKESLGRRIQEIREANNESQNDLAKALGIDRQVVKTWEAGTRHIKAPYLIALADHYDCTIDFLVGRSDNPSRNKNIQEICEYTGLSQWSIEELHRCKNDPERKAYIETVNALLENEDFFHDLAWNVTQAAAARTMWRIINDAGIKVHNPEFWNEANKVLTVANIASEEYSPFNYAEMPDSQNMPVLLPAGSWFLTTDDAADFLINRATEYFRDIITEHVEKWDVWPDLDFAPGANGKTQITVNEKTMNSDTVEQEDNHGKD